MSITDNYTSITRESGGIATITSGDHKVTLTAKWNHGAIAIAFDDAEPLVFLNLADTRDLKDALGFLAHVASRNAAEDDIQ